MVQVLLSEPPSADWKRLFYDAQQAPPPDFPPRAVEMSGITLRFRSEGSLVEQRIANQKEAAMGGRLGEERQRRREEMTREQQELAEWNARWSKL
jgi:hypothetical protein